VGLTVDVARQVFGGPADLEQLLLEVPPLGGMDRDGQVVEPGAQQRLDPLVPQDLLEHRTVVRAQGQPVRGVLLEGEPAVAGHRVGDVDEQGLRHGVAAVGE